MNENKGLHTIKGGDTVRVIRPFGADFSPLWGAAQADLVGTVTTVHTIVGLGTDCPTYFLADENGHYHDAPFVRPFLEKLNDY